MDILNPEEVWIEGRCYRKLPIKGSEIMESAEENTHTRIRSKEVYKTDEHDDVNLPIKHDGSRFHITIPIPGPLIGFVNGRKGQTRRTIEDQTTTQITIPTAMNKEIDTDIVIVGRSKENVASAYRRIEHIAKEARWKLGDYTHFISIPINDPSIQQGFNKFKSEVISKYRDAQGISEAIFEFPAKLHITVAMLTLLNNREKETVAGLMQKCRNEILHVLGDKSLCVEIKGIEYMNDDPSEVDVLYGLVKETDSDNCLQIISDKLADAFAKADLSRKELREHIKLHVTLMKSRSSDGGGRETFDARKILQNFADYTFGQMTLKEIHISVRFTGGKETYYTPSFVLNISK